MFTTMEELLITALGDNSLSHLLFCVIIISISALSAFIIRGVASLVSDILSKKSHLESVRLMGRFARRRNLPQKVAIFSFFYFISQLAGYLYSFARFAGAVSLYAMLLMTTIICACAIDVFGDCYSLKPIAKKRSIKGILQVIKIFLFVVFATIAVSVLIGQNPLVLISGMSAFAAILAIVFKDPLLGLVSGIQITADDLLHIGDWVSIPSMHVEGSITDISLISVRITCFDNTVSVVPAYTFLSAPFTNFRQAIAGDKRQFTAVINIDATTLRQLSSEEASALIESHKELSDLSGTISSGSTTNLCLYRHFLAGLFRESGHTREDYPVIVSTGNSEGRGIPVSMVFTTDMGNYSEYIEFASQTTELALVAMEEFGLSAFQEKTSDKTSAKI
ncbi:MAG: mechanosensitive ion channel family protein [Saccharofermentans sp.]|jgi:miniconductance mechanosensitive channel|nr:mechanosensitive ion channel family protein [Mageeibacillus sp.]MCI1264202.1 mechanosensitive ion channel family protein [Saccharofermentans sp.]MCI1275678.1 mechanosensitive ion channel family protein [Saccharofermentans sp.]MCI1769424.1 mechanosensitive ion channel family protein [Mageeibacillus sp.]MCI2044287.1 mechanosensitive ion channel family protein [Mageeibacillus sp.]